MKTDSTWKIILGVLLGIFMSYLLYGTYVIFKQFGKEESVEKVEMALATVDIEEVEMPMEVEHKEKIEEPVKPVVYDNMTMEELSAKLDRSLNSDLLGKGYLFASKSLELGVDPYVAVAIVLEETGCKWNCSNLVKQCNNVGGQKGGTIKCNGGAYRYFASLEEGIVGFIDNLARNYYAVGLTTPEQMNSKYAASKAWSTNVNHYIEKIKAS